MAGLEESVGDFGDGLGQGVGSDMCGGERHGTGGHVEDSREGGEMRGIVAVDEADAAIRQNKRQEIVRIETIAGFQVA
jgi:hypothetical protein